EISDGTTETCRNVRESGGHAHIRELAATIIAQEQISWFPIADHCPEQEQVQATVAVVVEFYDGAAKPGLHFSAQRADAAGFEIFGFRPADAVGKRNSKRRIALEERNQPRTCLVIAFATDGLGIRAHFGIGKAIILLPVCSRQCLKLV